MLYEFTIHADRDALTGYGFFGGALLGWAIFSRRQRGKGNRQGTRDVDELRASELFRLLHAPFSAFLITCHAERAGSGASQSGS